jgi:hypothetical protein
MVYGRGLKMRIARYPGWSIGSSIRNSTNLGSCRPSLLSRQVAIVPFELNTIIEARHVQRRLKIGYTAPPSRAFCIWPLAFDAAASIFTWCTSSSDASGNALILRRYAPQRFRRASCGSTIFGLQSD